jgi:2-hydroxychromene-2-carboxylate isomerase
VDALTDVEFFFDPSCPWTWVTSRWLTAVAPDRQLAVTWRTWSLPIKHEGKELPESMPAVWRARILAGQAFSTRALRVLEAVNAEEGNEAEGRLYTELGRRFHRDDAGPEANAGQVIAEALAGAGLPASLAAAGDDATWDEPVRDNMDSVRRQVGDDVAVPIIAVGGGHAMSGPIMAAVPSPERALAIWDAVATLLSEPTFFELKRHRTAGPKPPAEALLLGGQR